jgi:hypothetical protein
MTTTSITFDDLVAHGIASGATLHNGMPWAFTYEGFPVTHETDDLYLITIHGQEFRLERGGSVELPPESADVTMMREAIRYAVAYLHEYGADVDDAPRFEREATEALMRIRAVLPSQDREGVENG